MPERIAELRPEYVDTIPYDLVDGVLYISEKYQSAIHKCACGCGEEVVTPLFGCFGWELLKHESGAATLRPSIGNHQFGCRSHYYITENKVEWL